MSLTKQLLPVIFGQGIDNKTDDKLLPNGKLRYLKNASLKKGGTIAKRFGATALGTTIFDPNLATTPSLTNIKGIFSRRSSLGVFAQEPFANTNTTNYTNADLTNQNSLMIYNQSQNKWIDQHTAICAIHTLNQIFNVPNELKNPDSIYLSTSYTIYVANNDSFGYIFVIDTATSSIVSSATITLGQYGKVISTGTNVYAFFNISGSNNIAAYQINTNTNITSLGNIITNIDATGYFDVVLSGANIFLAYNRNGAAQITIQKYSSTLVAGASVNIAELGTNCVYCSTRSTGVDVFWHNGANGVRTQAYDINLTARGAIYTIEAYTATTVERICVTDVATVAAESTVLYEKTHTSGNDQLNEVRSARVNGTAVALANGRLLHTSGIASEIVPLDANTGLVVLSHTSTLQKTYFTALISLTASGNRGSYYIIGKLFYGTAAGVPERRLSQITPISATRYHVALCSSKVIEPNETLGAGIRSYNGASQVIIDFDNAYQYITEESDNNIFINGGYVQAFAGRGVTENGFHIFPEGITLAQSVGGGSIANGTYSYVAVYKYVDSNGAVHRSAPSPAVSITTTGANNTVTVTVPCLHFTSKMKSFNDMDLGEVRIEIYRTTNAGTLYYLAEDYSQGTFSNATLGLLDLVADTTLLNSRLLYTTGGVLENIMPPQSLFITPFKERIFSCDGNLRLYYSKSRIDGAALEFNDAMYIEMDAHGGPITGAFQLDDKLIVFKRNAIYYITGDGPNIAGGGGAFQTPIFVTAEVGCSYQSSIVSTPEGLIFNGARGIILLKPTLEVDYIGKEIEFFGSNTSYAATVVSEQNEARLLFNDGPCLVYNYLYRGWSINTNETANGWQGKGSCLFQNKYTHITNDGGVYQESNTFLDGSNNIFTKITTGWIALNSIAGFQRVYRAILLGRFMSNHDLKITIYYDYLPKPISTITVTPQSALNITTYTDAVLYADATYSGGTDPYEISLNLPIQKCQAVAFSIEDLNLGGTQEGFQLTAINFEIGVKATAARIKAAANIG